MELLQITGETVVPVLVYRSRYVAGFDPSRILDLLGLSGREETTADPPGNSLSFDQAGRVIEPGENLRAGLANLLERVGEELAYDDAKRGDTLFRLGMHDALRFTQNAIADLLKHHPDA